MKAPAADQQPILRVRDLGRTFDVSQPLLQRLVTGKPRKFVKAVDGVSFTIDRGTTFALVGESGCGKSTIARLIAGLERPTTGSIELNGKAAGRLRLQMVFQDPVGSLNPRWKIGRSVGEPLDPALGSAARLTRIAELLETVGLSASDAQKYPHEFSGGQRQRISIARALAADAELLLLDEPTSALDVSVQAQVLNLLKDLQRRLGLTYVFISHNLSVVRFLADRIGVMYLGRLVEVGDVSAILDSPQHPYTRLLIETVPNLEAPKRNRVPLAGELPSPLAPPSGCAFHPRCPLAMARCSQERPELRQVEIANAVACHAFAPSEPQSRVPRGVCS
jgi:peptide/nickel transport system ATP-binding protein